MLIKTPLLHQSFGPRVFLSFCLFILSVFLSFSLFLANSLERGGLLSSLSCPGFWDPLEKAHCTFTHSRGRPVPTCSSSSPKKRALLAFRVNQRISAYFSLSLSEPPGSCPLKDQHFTSCNIYLNGWWMVRILFTILEIKRLEIYGFIEIEIKNTKFLVRQTYVQIKNLQLVWNLAKAT